MQRPSAALTQTPAPGTDNKPSDDSEINAPAPVDQATLLAQLADDVAMLRASENRRESENQGRVAVWCALGGLLLTVGAPYYLPLAGKEQSYLGPQFQVYQSSMRPDLERAQNRLKEARAGLPTSASESYTAQTGQLMLNLASAYLAAHEMSAAQVQIAMFAELVDKDLKQQASVGLVPDGDKAPIKQIVGKVQEAYKCAEESKERVDVLMKALRQNSSVEAGVAGLARSAEDLRDIYRGQDHTSKCVAAAGDLHDHVTRAVLLHDSQVAAFNANAQRGAVLLKLLTGIGAALLFVYGRPALRTLQNVGRRLRAPRAIRAEAEPVE